MCINLHMFMIEKIKKYYIKIAQKYVKKSLHIEITVSLLIF